jgi:hypothetical protein
MNTSRSLKPPAARVSVTALDFDGPVEVRAGLLTRAETDGAAHIFWQGQGFEGNSAWLGVGLRGTVRTLGLAFRLDVVGAGANVSRCDVHEHPTLFARWNARAGESASFEKPVSLLTSRDTSEPANAAREALAQVPSGGFERLHAASGEAPAAAIPLRPRGPPPS